MNVIRYLSIIIFGLSAGLATAAAFVAFITVLGIFSKYAAKTRTAGNCLLYENCLMIGILIATLLEFFLSYSTLDIETPALPPFAIGIAILIAIGFFGGIYTGFLIGGLSEVLDTFPIYARKTHIAKNLPYVICSLALGKGVFNIIQAVMFGR